MTYEAVKEKLFWYIEHADQSKVMAIYTLLNEDMETGVAYDEATMIELRRRRDDMLSGNVKTYTRKETMDLLRDQMSRNCL